MKFQPLILLVAILIAITSCKKDKDNNVYIRFINETGNTIENAKVDSIFLGNIIPGSQTSYVSFLNLDMYYTSYPIFQFSGYINGQKISRTELFDFVPPQKHEVPPGKYEVEIKPYPNSSPQTYWILFK